jgi:hypothetical protein
LALEVLAQRQSDWSGPVPKRLAAVVNSGFPEAHQNALALAICGRFAHRAGLIWAGGLALGGGEAMSGGAPLVGPGRKGRPPAGRTLEALELTANALGSGQPIPARAQQLLSMSPIPGLPAGWWQALYRWMGEYGWKQQARTFGLTPAVLRQPCEQTRALG